LVKEAWFRRYDSGELPARFDQVVQSWDTANKPTELSDYSVCTTWGIKDKRFYLLHVLRKRMGYPDLKRAVREQWQTHGATVVLIEDKASGTQLIQELIHEGVHAVTRYKPDCDKLMRLHAQTGAIENGFVYLPREAHWLAQYLHELTTFPNSKYDDQVDSTSQALAWTKQGSSAEAWMEWIRHQVEGSSAGTNGLSEFDEQMRQGAKELMDIYRGGLATLKPVRICAGCGNPITDTTRISDGVDHWHIGCQGRLKR
jgi:predicted phage terminase large subunit-like protein